MIPKQLRDKIVSQALTEIQFNRRYKNGKIKNWQTNEDMYYGKKISSQESRANVSLGRMQEFVHTLLSKIDNPLVFKFTKRKESQLKRVLRLNSMRESDRQLDCWDVKDIVGKKQAIMYGRAIYSYHASSDNGYKANLEPVDVYDFLIDPSCGGIDIELARNMGRYNIVLDRQQLKEGVKNGIYIRDNVAILNSGNSTETSEEENNKRKRSYDISSAQKEIDDKDKFKFWQWYTTFNGERYFLLMTNSGNCIRCELLKDVFSNNLYPFWTWACFPDLTEFWTPSYCDYAREIFMAQDVSINQMLDNAEAINKPQKVVNVEAIKNLAQLKYRRDGIIESQGDVDANKALQIIQTPSINTPIQVFNILETIQQSASGVTAGTKGMADEEGKVGIYEGNQAASSDRFGLLNKSYSFGYHRFAKLYENGIKDHLIKKIAVEIIGPNGVEFQEINRKDIYRKDDKYGVFVEASNSEQLNSIQTQRTKLTFLSNQANNPEINKKKSFEIEASIAGFSEDEIKQLLDNSAYGDQETISEAERDIESLLSGEQIKPNRIANIAYKQHIVDWVQDHEENINQEQFFLILDYISQIEPIIIRNETREMNYKLRQEMINSQPLEQTIEEPITNKYNQNYELQNQEV